MATATQIIDALAEVLGKTSSSVEAYALYLRRTGRWTPTKRGRGASALTDSEVAKLLLAIMSDGPNSLPGWWLDYANLSLLPDLRDDPASRAVREALGLPRTAEFLDYLIAIVAAFREDRAHLVFSREFSPIGFLGDESDTPEIPRVDVSVQGPHAFATIAFAMSTEILKEISPEHERSGGGVMHRLIFVDQLIGWRADAIERGEDVQGHDRAIALTIEQRSKGVRYQRAIGSREISAVAKAMRPAGGQE